MLTRIWILFLPATLEQTHCVDIIGGPSGLGDGHILPAWELEARAELLSNDIEEGHSAGENNMQGG